MAATPGSPKLDVGRDPTRQVVKIHFGDSAATPSRKAKGSSSPPGSPAQTARPTTNPGGSGGGVAQSMNTQLAFSLAESREARSLPAIGSSSSSPQHYNSSNAAMPSPPSSARRVGRGGGASASPRSGGGNRPHRSSGEEGEHNHHHHHHHHQNSSSLLAETKVVRDALMRWPSSAARAPTADTLVRRRVATAKNNTTTSAQQMMANSVLTLIERVGGDTSALLARNTGNDDPAGSAVDETHDGGEEASDPGTNLFSFAFGTSPGSASSSPSARSNRRTNAHQQQQHSNNNIGLHSEVARKKRRQSVAAAAASGETYETVLAPTDDPAYNSSSRHFDEFEDLAEAGIPSPTGAGVSSSSSSRHKHPPTKQRPAQRDFLSWSSGASRSYDSFASVNRWVEWVIQEADFHAGRISAEAGSRRSGKDALDLAEVMKSNFDGLLGDAATFYEEIQARATEINDCVRAWARASSNVAQQHYSTLANEHHDTGKPVDPAAGEPFLVRAALLVLDKVMSHSAVMAKLWPHIRSCLCKGLFVKGDEVANDNNHSDNDNSNNKNNNDHPKQQQQQQRELAAQQLGSNPLVIEQYDELLGQFRDAERQRFHLESTTSQLSAFSDLTVKHTNRRLLRSAFKAWRAQAQAGRVQERLLVHFARQTKAKEICGRSLHRWRSYMQMQRRNRAVKQMEETRRKMRAEAALHEQVLEKLKEDHQRELASLEIRILQSDQQYEAAVEAAALEREMFEHEIADLTKQLDRSRHETQQWRTAALLSRPTEGPDAVALYADTDAQKQAVLEMSLALAPPSKKLQQLISTVRGTEDALYLATMRTAEVASIQRDARTRAMRRQVDTSGGVASPTASSLAKSATFTSFYGTSTNNAATNPSSSSPTNNNNDGGGGGGAGWGQLPKMEYTDGTSGEPSSPLDKQKSGVQLFVKDQWELDQKNDASQLSKTLRSSTAATALQKPQVNFQALAAAARESVQSFLVEWVNEMLAKSSVGRTVMHAGVQRNAGGATTARTISNLTTDLYDGSVYLSLCKAIMPLDHQRRGETDVFSTLVSTLFVFTAHGLQPPLLQNCPFYRRFFRAETFGTFIHPTAGLWIVASLFVGYAMRTAQSPTYRSHAALSPVHQYSPSGHHKVAKSARNDVVTRPPLNVLIMSGINTCGYGTKKATVTNSPRGDAALLQRIGVQLDKSISSSATGGGGGGNDNDDDDDGHDDKSKKSKNNKETDSSAGAGGGGDDDDDLRQDHEDDDNEGKSEDSFFGDSVASGDQDQVDVQDEAFLPAQMSPKAHRSLKQDMDAWLSSSEACEAAQQAVPETLLQYGPTELLAYWRMSQENRSIWVGMARVITSLAVRFRVFDVDTKRSEQNTMRRHMQLHMANNMTTAELRVDSTAMPGRR